MHQAESEGLDGFLIKPLSPSVLLDAIMHAFGKETGQRQPAFGKDNEMTVALKNIQGAHLLLAEDNEINRKIAVNMLEKRGHTVTIAENGRIALEILQDDCTNSPFDLILMDVQMPEMDGFEATARIRKAEKCEV